MLAYPRTDTSEAVRGDALRGPETPASLLGSRAPKRLPPLGRGLALRRSHLARLAASRQALRRRCSLVETNLRATGRDRIRSRESDRILPRLAPLRGTGPAV